MPPKESTEKGRRRMLSVRRSRETEEAVEAMPALLTVVRPVNLVNSAIRCAVVAASAVVRARRQDESLVLTVVTSMAT